MLTIIGISFHSGFASSATAEARSARILHDSHSSSIHFSSFQTLRSLTSDSETSQQHPVGPQQLWASSSDTVSGHQGYVIHRQEQGYIVAYEVFDESNECPLRPYFTL